MLCNYHCAKRWWGEEVRALSQGKVCFIWKLEYFLVIISCIQIQIHVSFVVQFRCNKVTYCISHNKTWCASYSEIGYTNCTAAWKEQRQFLDLAFGALGSHPVTSVIKSAASELKPSVPDITSMFVCLFYLLEIKMKLYYSKTFELQTCEIRTPLIVLQM